MRIAAAIPAFQAGASVADVVRRTREVLPDVIVVDDGSSDATAEAARGAGAELAAHAVNRGKGAALVTAFRTLFGRGCDAVVTLDADGQHLPEEIPKLLAAAHGGADLVLARATICSRRWCRRAGSRTVSPPGPSPGPPGSRFPTCRPASLSHAPPGRSDRLSGNAFRRGERRGGAGVPPRLPDRDRARPAGIRGRTHHQPLIGRSWTASHRARSCAPA